LKEIKESESQKNITKLIVGLGNPGKKYENTRHSLGFLFLDFFKEKYNFPEFKEQKKFFGEVSEGNFNSCKLLLLKPLTFMNESGKSVLAISKFYKIKAEEILLVFDDIDMEFGKIRFRERGSSGGHNGLKNIFERFGTESFPRIKMGIKNEIRDFARASDFVLSKFSKEESEKIPEFLGDAMKKVELVLDSAKK